MLFRGGGVFGIFLVGLGLISLVLESVSILLFQSLNFSLLGLQSCLKLANFLLLLGHHIFVLTLHCCNLGIKVGVVRGGCDRLLCLFSF